MVSRASTLDGTFSTVTMILQHSNHDTQQTIKHARGIIIYDKGLVEYKTSFSIVHIAI